MLNHPTIQAIIGWLMARYMKFVWWTSRWEVIGQKALTGLDDRGAIILIWHGRFLAHHAVWKFNTKKPAHFLISKSKEGDLITQVALKTGARAVRGSMANPKKKDKAKGGIGATKNMVRLLKKGEHVLITPDGPRGPLMHLHPGAIKLAQLSGAPILLVSWSTNRRVMLGSWDRFVIPLPFGRGCTIWHDSPIEIARGADAGKEAQYCRDKLEALTQFCDIEAGHPLINTEAVSNNQPLEKPES